MSLNFIKDEIKLLILINNFIKNELCGQFYEVVSTEGVQIGKQVVEK